ncbi:MAG: FISUMP domain-containing protein [Bacteroidales bacterium]
MTTDNVAGITQTSALTGGNVTDDGNAEVTARGVCWGTSQNPTTGSSKTSDGTGTGNFTSSITGLTPGTTYYVRAYATNSEGTSYGNEVTFSSNPVLLATLTTTIPSSVTQTTAVSGGDITLDGGGAITGRGVCWSTTANPTTALTTKTSDGTGTGTFTSNIAGLTTNTKYYLRAYAINSAGTAYGNELDFTTADVIGGILFNPDLTYGTVSDNDGNTYKTIQIGTQNWMAENLKTTKLNDNTQIPNVTDFNEWRSSDLPAYFWYDNNATTYKAVYGALYNWYTVNTGKLCPSGWHVPTYDDFNTLVTYLGGENMAGGKLKEAGTSHWRDPNGDATNESGFTGLPGGQRDITADFAAIGGQSDWWSTTNTDQVHAYTLEVSYSDGKVFLTGGMPINDGFNVRCIKN